jgi:hypothetical protein
MKKIFFLVIAAACVWPLLAFAQVVPAKTGEFLVFCQRNKKICNEKIFNIHLALIVNLEGLSGQKQTSRYCGPDEDDTDKLAAEVLKRLEGNSRDRDRPYGDTIKDLLRSLYPCKP